MKKLKRSTFSMLLSLVYLITLGIPVKAQWVAVQDGTGGTEPTQIISEGTIIGSAGSYSGTTSDDKTKVFDGNINTYFDAASAHGQWVGKDLKENYRIDIIEFCPRNGAYDRMYGGKIQISTDAAFTNPVTIYTIPIGSAGTGAISQFKYYKIQNSNVANPTQSRYIRYLSPDNGYGNIAEIKLSAFVSAPPPPPANVTTFSGNINLNGFKLVGAKDSNKGLKVDAAGQIWVDSTIFGHQMYAHTYWGRYTEPVPDYVFNKNYTLQPLTQVEEYIKKYKHLPDVPSDSAYKQKGAIDIQELNLILLRKVEELTLHLIDLDKRNRTLQQQNRRLLNAANKKNK